MSHIGKVLMIVLLNRLMAQTEEYLADEQAGFRKDRSTIQQILMLRLIAEKAKRKTKPIYNCFVDFQKAFDSIKQDIISATLRSFIHSFGHFYSAPSSPLLPRGAPDYSTDTVSEFHAEAHRQQYCR